jgi:hypothetical protein
VEHGVDEQLREFGLPAELADVVTPPQPPDVSYRDRLGHAGGVGRVRRDGIVDDGRRSKRVPVRGAAHIEQPFPFPYSG